MKISGIHSILFLRSLIFLLFFLPKPGASQSLQLSGKVVDHATGEPLAYALLQVDGSFYGTVTDENGVFDLVLPPTISSKIKVSSLGYSTASFAAGTLPQLIRLKADVVRLNEVTVSAPTLEPQQLVRKALGLINQNYYKEPILLNTFYRHYCQDNGTYGRIIEAMVDVYKGKGYGRVEKYKASKDKVAVRELRRSFDQTQVAGVGHLPIALDFALKSDIISLRSNKKKELDVFGLLIDSENFLTTALDYFIFDYAGTRMLNDEEVFVVNFRLDKSRKTEFETGYNGRLFINTANYAITRFECEANGLQRELRQIVSYKKYDRKYALFHTVSKLKSNQGNQTHEVHVELLVHNLVKGKQKGFLHIEPDRQYLASVPYRPEFWKNYAPVKTHETPQQAIADLEAGGPLEQQFAELESRERQMARDTRMDENLLMDIIEQNQGLLVIDLWASWCVPCIKQYAGAETARKTMAKKGVHFLMVSIDEDWNRWRHAIESFGMADEKHLKIGPDARFLDLFDMNTIPRYLLYQDQMLIHRNAPAPGKPEFDSLINGLLNVANE